MSKSNRPLRRHSITKPFYNGRPKRTFGCKHGGNYLSGQRSRVATMFRHAPPHRSKRFSHDHSDDPPQVDHIDGSKALLTTSAISAWRPGGENHASASRRKPRGLLLAVPRCLPAQEEPRSGWPRCKIDWQTRSTSATLTTSVMPL